MNLTDEQVKANHEARIAKLVTKRDALRASVDEFNQISHGLLMSSLREHGYPSQGDTLEIQGEEYKLEREGFHSLRLTSEQQYKIIVGKKKNGEWSKRSASKSLPNDIPCWARYGDLLWGSY